MVQLLARARLPNTSQPLDKRVAKFRLYTRILLKALKLADKDPHHSRKANPDAKANQVVRALSRGPDWSLQTAHVCSRVVWQDAKAARTLVDTTALGKKHLHLVDGKPQLIS